MPNNDTSTQNSSQNNQNFEIDVQEMYQDFVTGTPANQQNVSIDDIRSQINISIVSQSGKSIIDSLNIDPNSNSNTSTVNTTTPGTQAQESRCHTFYRILGFPVVNSDKVSFYNPGFDPIVPGIVRKIQLADKIKIAENAIVGFNEISKYRENWVNDNLKIFSTPNTIDAAVFSLTSGTYGNNGTVNLRNFTAPFDKNKNLDPFDMTLNNQSYTLGGINSTLVGEKIVHLSSFQDINGNFPSSDNRAGGLKQHFHIITPFTVDPRIDFSVFPIDSGSAAGVSKRIAVPFVQNQSYLKISSNCSAERPLIEKILRERFSQSNSVLDSGTATQDLIKYITSFKSIQNQDLVNKISSGDIYKLSQQNAFAKYLSIIQAMIFKLIDSLQNIHKSQGMYYWLPIPSSTGPEGGCSVRSIIQSTLLDNNLITQNDFQIILFNAQAMFNKQVATSANTISIPDIGNFAFSAFKLTFSSDTSASLGDNSAQTLENLVSKRNKILNKASTALQTVEMIMGEFSGFGLCDIIAIMGSLYIMDKNLLLEFLDDDSLDRMNLSLGIKLTKTNNLVKAMSELATTINQFYSIMQQIYLDSLNNNSLNV